MSLNIFRCYHEEDRQWVHCHILAILFYMDHYHEDNSPNDGVKLSHVFAHIQQTHEFNSFN